MKRKEGDEKGREVKEKEKNVGKREREMRS